MEDVTIEKKATFDFVRYASVWEDADILCEALAPSSKQGRILSIASAGDNVLALLTIDPKEIVAADLSQAQLACLELRMRAFEQLDHAALLSFLGITKSSDRISVYTSLRKGLSDTAKQYWDTHSNDIANGIIHAGKFEKYLKTFGKRVLSLIHSKKKREGLLQVRTAKEQQEFYDNTWDSILWRLLFRIFFSKTLMGTFGRDPAFFDHVEGSVSGKILGRTKHALTELPTHSNPYLAYIITGNYNSNALPRYLRKEHKNLISDRINRITLINAPIHQVHSGKFDGFNLSDIFEYMDEQEFEKCCKALVSQANPYARFAYWNMLVPRKISEKLTDRVKPLTAISKELHWKDKAWFYQAFHVDEVSLEVSA